MSLYYTVASLPGLMFGDPPPLLPEELVRQCEGVLGDANLASLRAVVAGESAIRLDGRQLVLDGNGIELTFELKDWLK